MLFGFGLQPFHSRGKFVGRHREKTHRCRRRVAERAKPPERAAAAEKLDPLTTLEPVPRRDRDDADRAGPGDVRAAARRQIEAVDVDEPKLPFPPRLLAERHPRRIGGVGERNLHRPIFPDDSIGLVLGGGDVARRQLAREVDRRHGCAEVKADGPDVEQMIERRGQHVLSRVLLHVIEPPRPVDRAVNVLPGLQAGSSGPGRFGGSERTRPPRGKRGKHVSDAAVLGIEDVDDGQSAERASVERLSARGRIESGAVEGDERASVALRRAGDRRVKLAEVRIRVIQPIGHGCGPVSRRPAARRKTSRRPTRSAGTRSSRRTNR